MVMGCPHCQVGVLLLRPRQGQRGERYVCDVCARIFPIELVKRMEKAAQHVADEVPPPEPYVQETFS